MNNQAHCSLKTSDSFSPLSNEEDTWCDGLRFSFDDKRLLLDLVTVAEQVTPPPEGWSASRTIHIFLVQAFTLFRYDRQARHMPPCACWHNFISPEHFKLVDWSFLDVGRLRATTTTPRRGKRCLTGRSTGGRANPAIITRSSVADWNIPNRCNHLSVALAASDAVYNTSGQHCAQLRRLSLD